MDRIVLAGMDILTALLLLALFIKGIKAIFKYIQKLRCGKDD